jgi:DNA polymerase/3'-5' exonuclease PolX
VYEAIAYERARNIIKALPETMAIEADVDRLLHDRKGIGTKLLTRIKEVVATGVSEKLESLESNEKVSALSTFMSIWGVGQKLANELYQKGCRTLNDVRSIQDQLPLQVQKALRVHEELQVKMLREEVKKLADVVESTLHDRFQNTVLTVCGSYRRNEVMCGDIDMIINPIGETTGHERYTILSTLISDLAAKGFLTDHLALPTVNKGDDERFSYMGIAQLKPDALHRRIDIKIYPEEHMPFALAYFTGDSQFVRKMRLHARRMVGLETLWFRS